MHISVLISPSRFFIISKVWSWWYTCGRKLFRWKRCRRIEGGLRQVGSWHGSRRASWRIFRHDPSTCQGMGTVMQSENSQTGNCFSSTMNLNLLISTVFLFQINDRYFLDSNDKIRYFFETDAFDENGKLQLPKDSCLNKIGHALHWIDPRFKKVWWKI